MCVPVHNILICFDYTFQFDLVGCFWWGGFGMMHCASINNGCDIFNSVLLLCGVY